MKCKHITYRDIFGASLYVFCEGTEPYTEEDDFLYDLLHFKFLKRHNLV